MKTILKAKRNAIYKLALELYQSDIITDDGTLHGFCWYLTKAAKKYYPSGHKNAYETMETNYPEIIKHKPESYNDGYWWPLTQTVQRIAILEQAIKETENETESKN